MVDRRPGAQPSIANGRQGNRVYFSVLTDIGSAISNEKPSFELGCVGAAGTLGSGELPSAVVKASDDLVRLAIGTLVTAGASQAERAPSAVGPVLLCCICNLHKITLTSGRLQPSMRLVQHDKIGPIPAGRAYPQSAWHAVACMISFFQISGNSTKRVIVERVVTSLEDEKGSAMAEKSAQSESAETSEPIAEAAPDTQLRDEMASNLVNRFALWSGVAGLIPVPVVDTVAVGGLQIQMIRRLSQIYDVEFSENRTKALIASLAGSMIPATSGIGAASLLKAVPVIGTIAAGFVMPALSAGATYAIGKAFIQHFASGGTLLDFNAPDYREFIKAQREMWDSRSRSTKSSQAGSEATSTAAGS